MANTVVNKQPIAITALDSVNSISSNTILLVVVNPESNSTIKTVKIAAKNFFNAIPVPVSSGIVAINTISVSVGSNLSINSSTVFIGNSTVNATANSSTIHISNSTVTVSLNNILLSMGATASIMVGNSTVNVVVNSTAIKISDVANSTTVSSTGVTTS